jgi:uncharacterized membrane protein
MMNLEPLSQAPSQKVNKVLVWVFLFLSLVGFLDATYLTAKHYLGGPIVCPIFGGCEDVLNSAYSLIGFVPVAMLGMFYYSFLLVLLVAYLDFQKIDFLKWAARLTAVGLVASVWFMFAQFILIQALCFYCVVSATISTFLFVLGLWILKTTK